MIIPASISRAAFCGVMSDIKRRIIGPESLRGEPTALLRLGKWGAANALYALGRRGDGHHNLRQ
jgi:hypothetical protein